MDQLEPIKVLGEGAFGKVYLMRDKVVRVLVCVKVIKVKNIPKKEREACRMEVALLKRLNHPNIVGYRDSFLAKNKESLCIVMQFADGGDLAAQIKLAARNRKLFNESKILHWFVQMALGLHYMHANRVLHRDLKTQNIFLLGNGRLVLGDLGISKVLEGTMDFAQTCIGTPYYMSPEIFKNKPYNHKSDIWALGCVLYEMTTLNHAFDANSLNGLACKIIKGRYPPIANRYSRHLRELIAMMLSTAPSSRPQLEAILKRPFVKRHIKDFLSDIVSRPTCNIGDGTMAVRAAVLCVATDPRGPGNGGGVVGGGHEARAAHARLASDLAVQTLRSQLDALQMQDVISAAFEPVKQLPLNPAVAEKQAREQASALRREEDRRNAVETALAKLKLEREQRLRDRERLRDEARQRAAARHRPAPHQRGVSDERRGWGGKQQHQVQPVPLAPRARANGRSEQPVEQYGVVGGGLKPAADRQRQRSDHAEERRERNDNPGPRRLRPGVLAGGARDGADAARVAELERWEDHQQRAQVERQRVRRGEDRSQASKEEASEARGADARQRCVEAQRDAERQRQRLVVARLREDKIALDASEAERMRRRDERRREVERELERDAQHASAASLLPVPNPSGRRRTGASLESDAHESAERGRCAQRESAAAAKAVPSGRASYGAFEGCKGSSSSEAKEDRVRRSPRPGRDVVPAVAEPLQQQRHAVAESGLTQRERVMLRKQQSAAEAEQQRLAVLNEAHVEGAQQRQQAKAMQSDQYRSSLDTVRSSNGRRSTDQLQQAKDTSAEDSQSDRKSAQSTQPAADHPEPYAAHKSEYEEDEYEEDDEQQQQQQQQQLAQQQLAQQPPLVSRRSQGEQEVDEALDGSDEDENEDESMGWALPDPDCIEDVEEDIEHREEELKAELEFATARCEELRKTLHDTKTFIAKTNTAGVPITQQQRPVVPKERMPERDRARAQASSSNDHASTAYTEEDEDETDEADDDEVIYEESEDEDDCSVASSGRQRNAHRAQRKDERPRQTHIQNQQQQRDARQSPPPRAVRPIEHAPRTPRQQQREVELSDQPSPTGRLADRIHILRQRCIKALSLEVYQEAYSYLKSLQEADDVEAEQGLEMGGEAFGGLHDSEEAAKARLRGILGADKVHFSSLIDQLIFMEESL